MSGPDRPMPRGRGAHSNPPNRFEPRHYERDDSVEGLDDGEIGANPATQYLPDHARSVVTENQSPDVGFRYSLNPYRGCSHGCAYCYARPTHEYLGFSAGLDFETKILVKEAAPELFRAFLARPSWRPEPIVMSGVTDPYQPGERHYQLTRRCLEVAKDARQPISIITKNALIRRDLDLLGPMAAANLVHVNISVTTLDTDLARVMEPRTSTPAARLRTIGALAEAGVPVRVLVAPVIPGLNDSEMPAILAAAKEAGAQAAAHMLLRLPGAVAPVFREWLERTHPGRLGKIEGRIRSTHGGKLNDAAWGRRMSGTGELAEQVHNLFRLFARRHGLDGDLPPYDTTQFRPPPRDGQPWLF